MRLLQASNTAKEPADKLLKLAITLADASCAPLPMPISGRIGYAVSHGLSYAGNGYAVRTQGIAKALNEHRLETLCFIRPGRPWELQPHRGPVPLETGVQDVRHIHSRWPEGKRPQNEQEHLEYSAKIFEELFRVYRPAAVLAASNWIVGLPAWVAARRLGLPFYNEVRGFWELSRDAREPGYAASKAGKLEAARDTFVARQANKVFTLSNSMRAELVERGLESSRIGLVPNGVSELPEIKPPDPGLKETLGIQGDDKVIGYIGTFNPYEGLDVLIQACDQLVKKGEQIKLLLVGDNQPVTKAMNVSSNIAAKPWLIQLGRVPHEEIADYYGLIDTVVIPRNRLALCEKVPPIKAAEALAHGKRLVVSDVEPLVEFGQKHEGVVSFEAGNAESLAQTFQGNLEMPVPEPSTELFFSAHTMPMVRALEKKGKLKSDKRKPQTITVEKAKADIVRKIGGNEVQKKKWKRLVQYTFPIVGQRLVVDFEVVSEVPYAHDQVVAGIELQDANGGFLDSESYRFFNYGWSAHYGRYKYLSANSGGARYTLTIELPAEASLCVLRLGSRHGAKVSVTSELSISFYTGELESEIRYSLRGSLACDSPEEVAQLLESLQFNVSYATAVAKAIEPLPMTEMLKADVFWYLWRLTNDPATFEMARQHLIFQGRMYDTKRLLNEWDEKANFKNGKNSARRVEDEIKLLENGMSMPKKRQTPLYKPTRNVLYLLHNRLPYNSGGYAMRTHGLLTGIEKNSNFKMHGVSRPGYPSDHAKHISKRLPKIIPRVDMVDGISYFALDQKRRRSSLTMTEYVEAYSKEVEALAIEKKASIIHAAANFPNGLAASLAARRLGIKSVYEVRGLWEITRLSRQEGWNDTDQFRLMAKMETEACNAANAVITITDALKELMVARGVDSSKITTVPNCVHTSLFSPLEKDQQMLKELGLTEKDIVIGYIGSIVNYEGIDDLLEAIAILVKNGVTNIKFLLVGDGAALDGLKRQALNLGLEKYVIITGRVSHDEVQRYYSLVDIAPFPRKPYLVCEVVSPLKPFEAMACQKAVIVSNCGALTEIVQDRYNGLVFKKGDVMSLKAALMEFIINKKFREQLAASGRSWVLRQRDWSVSARLIAKMYRDLRGGR